MKNMIAKIGLVISVFMITLGQSVAQENSQWTDTIEVSISRIPLGINKTGRDITVITASEISKLPSTSIDDLLQYIPGIEVQSRNAFGAQGDITMRGATFSQVLVLVDGMRLNDPLTAHFNSYIPVSLAEIEKIEVLRGAAAATFGADAVGGVINIVTKTFGQSNSSDNTIEGGLNFGENRLIKAHQGFFNQKGRLKLSGGIDITQSDGELISFDPSLNLENYNNFFDIKTIGAAIGYSFNNKLKLNARLAYDNRDFSARYFYTNSTFDKSTETVSNWWNHVQLNHISTRSSTKYNLAYKRNSDVFVFSPDFPSTNNHTSELLNFNIQHLRQLSQNWTINVGVDLDQRSIESTDRGDHSDFHFGAYALSAFQPAENWFVNTSIRLDHDDNYGFEFSPNVNIAWRLGDVNLRGSTGRSIRAADYTERYVSFNLSNLTPGRSFGNANLNAESSWSHEMGLDWKISNQLSFASTAYLRNSSSLIDYVPTLAENIPFNENLQPGETYFFASNVTDVNTKGLEFKLDFSKKFSDDVVLDAQVAYTTIETTNEEDVISVYISSHARALFQTNWTLQMGAFNLGLNGLIKKRNERVAEGVAGKLDPKYGIWNINSSYSITDQFGVKLQIHNLFDQSYQDILGAPMPGRWIMAGIHYKL